MLVLLPPLLAAAGALLLMVGLVLVRRSGARPGMGRRLAGAHPVHVGELLDLGPTAPLPIRPVRVMGRIRCAEPIVTAEDDRLVAFHRDVDVASHGGSWRSIERLRESRSFELWDHDGSLQVDPAEAAEPLVVIPHVWTGTADELEESYAPALARVATEHGPPTKARAVTRMVSVVDRLLLLAVVTRADGVLALRPPPGGYILSTLELDDAMRLLGGPRPRLMLAGMACVAVAGVLLVLAGTLTLLGIGGG